MHAYTNVIDVFTADEPSVATRVHQWMYDGADVISKVCVHACMYVPVCIAGYLSFGPMAQCVVLRSKALLAARGCASPSRAR